MIVVQRITTYWTKQSRGGGAATRRNAVPEAFPLQAPGPAGVLVNEVEAHERDGFTALHTIRTSDRPSGSDSSRAEDPGGGSFSCDAVSLSPVTRGVFLMEDDGRLRVVVSPPPARLSSRGPRHLFTLGPGEYGRRRFNSRFTPSGCGCHSHQWWYEKWVVNVAYPGGTPAPNLFTQREPTHVLDRLVRLS
ncbi:hypothetical protein [Streptomyces sp. 11x1]|uniref:hypothetical protein n=1 Tax=Streptomyces sp. 11x1 TaxID=3038642 RepID=UPI00292FAB64|nr:hypothetical protein [Streptomyces sp. 11x1]WNZ14235.1 hypothetical protein P8T65_46225 [Streptomyces sp. 11x1]